MIPGTGARNTQHIVVLYIFTGRSPPFVRVRFSGNIMAIANTLPKEYVRKFRPACVVVTKRKRMLVS